jgi:N-methylhydantoinase B
MRAGADPAELSIAAALFSSVAEEMGVTLGRTAHSPNIKERRDYSCAVFDREGRLVAQAAHIPVHLGAMPTAIEAVMPLSPFRAGDLFILNDPYLGGTHLPDITMVSPVFRARRLLGFVASRAHQADVGGMSPGSMPLAEELIQEGVVIPPIRLLEAGRLSEGVLALLLRNMRAPEERRADLRAQMAAQSIGETRLREVHERFGLRRAGALSSDLLAYSERMTREALRTLPGGAYDAEDFLDDDGVTDEPVRIRVRVTLSEGAIHCDFTGSAAERASSVNAVAAVTRSAVYYVVRCLLEARPEGATVPANDGCFRPVSFTLPERSVVNAGPPRAVAAGNVETSQRIVDVVLAALATAAPGVVPASSQGTMNNVAIGGHRADGSNFAYYETIAGGTGGTPRARGESAVHSHMTNTMNTPIEALEMAYPFRVSQYTVRRGSGGAGEHPGGDGIARTYEFMQPVEVTLLTERRRAGAPGLAGGKGGVPGRNYAVIGGKRRKLSSKGHVKVGAGDRLTIETPGGGGWGVRGRKGAKRAARPAG